MTSGSLPARASPRGWGSAAAMRRPGGAGTRGGSHSGSNGSRAPGDCTASGNRRTSSSSERRSPCNSSRTAPDTTIQGQTRLALESTKKVFEAAGTTLANATKCTVFLTDVKDFAGMNSVYREFFPVAPPARSTVVVAALVSTGAKVEIECAGYIP